LISGETKSKIEEQVASGAYEYVCCNLCGSDNAKIYAARVWRKGGNNLHLRRDRCKKCGLVYSNPQASEETLKEYYEREAFKDSMNDIATKMEELVPKHQLFWKGISEQIKPGRFLDVGCNTGHFLSVGQKYGWDVYGVDLSEHAIRYGQGKLGLKNLQLSDLFNAQYPDNFFDYVHCWHALEHVTDPTALLFEINRIMKKGAKLIIGVPGVTDPMYYTNRLMNRLRKISPPFSSDIAHCFEFTGLSLKNMLKKTGFGILETKVYYDSLEEVLPKGGWRYKSIVYFFWYLAQVFPNYFGNRVYSLATKKRSIGGNT